uniref:Uncharacterized protein n=1 Tax=Anguilla anguilla TaxID=7936 RepID=A0A0E9P5A3_ANGAN
MIFLLHAVLFSFQMRVIPTLTHMALKQGWSVMENSSLE